MKKNKYFVKKIFEWGQYNYRNFIWRKCKTNSFVVFISEFFLRKTRAETVETFLKNFLVEFKSFGDLKNVSVNTLKSKLNKIGLHNQRSEALKIISEKICSDEITNLNGDLILTFPECGKYIANAYDIFFNHIKGPLVDSNIQRVFSRYFSLEKSKEIHKAEYLWDFAYSLLPDKEYDLYNYYLLDFASLVCKSSKPLCTKCPLNKKCDYMERGKTHV